MTEEHGIMGAISSKGEIWQQDKMSCMENWNANMNAINKNKK